jgi:hypothetical protein
LRAGDELDGHLTDDDAGKLQRQGPRFVRGRSRFCCWSGPGSNRNQPRIGSSSVFDVINMLEGYVVGGTAVNVIDRDQSMVTLCKRNIVIGLG